MGIWPGEGEIWGCCINAHRSAWDGTICRDPCDWNCGGQAEFRRGYCDAGDERCFHLRTFSEQTPCFTIDDNGAGWLMAESPESLNDQVVLIYTYRFEEPTGIRRKNDHIVAGYYVVDRVEEFELPYKSLWRVFPKQDACGPLHELGLRLPRYRSARGPYLRHFDAAAVARLKQSIEEAIDNRSVSPSGKASARRFLENADRWMSRAWKQNKKLLGAHAEPENAVVYESADNFSNSPFAALRDRTIQVHEPERKAATAVAPQPAPAAAEPAGKPAAPSPAEPSIEAATPVEETPTGVAPLIDAQHYARLAQEVGRETAQALLLGGLAPNALILLRGAPGMGKSRLATSLAPPERRHVVSIASTWRGREDLLGYVEPVSGRFLPTPFTEFIRDACTAFEEGDRDPWLVVFEEFNLSPPEYWFSDLLVRSQYEPEARQLRTIPFGGKAPERWSEGPGEVWLPPTVRFIGTMNSDHTTRVLSPRVLDRAHLVALSLSVDAIIERAELGLSDAQREAIRALDDALNARGIRFSVRAASAIARGMAQSIVQMDDWLVIDFVLLNQLLSRVRLHAGDPGDHALVDTLGDVWSQEHGARLPLCAARIEQWAQHLDHGLDVVQA